MSDFASVEAAIRQLHARYADAVWRKDYDAFAACFALDAEWRIGGHVLRGRQEITQRFRDLMTNFNRVLMHFSTPLLDVEDAIASGRTYSVEECVFVNGGTGKSIGVYYERFVDQGDCWRFSWRLFQLEYFDAADLSGTFYNNPDYGPPPGTPALDAPTIDHLGLGAR